MSKRMLVAMKPSMWEPPRSANVSIVTISPVSEIAPNFLVHHATSISDVKARKSHRNACIATAMAPIIPIRLPSKELTIVLGSGGISIITYPKLNV